MNVRAIVTTPPYAPFLDEVARHPLVCGFRLNTVMPVRDGPTEAFALDDKPDNEFQTNFAMVGGGALYAVRMEGASDEVRNLRLPVNHHVTYVLVFRRTTP